MENEFKDAEEYASTIRDIILNTPTEPGDEPMPDNLLKYWANNMYRKCYSAYNDYIVGKREDYRLTDEEANDEFEKAGLKYTQELVDGLVDKDYLQVSVSPTGELLYSATEKGTREASKHKDIKDFFINTPKTKKHGRPRKK